ncbi:Hypothetical predicted protein [Octopus vulgaris]|uniref:Uncharacterized protein n=1 Tax=Octopus vulgaris TaxID=6645 RepID=A0AA36F3W1_OCTVU|nr:Hypothetical predicted protein [Octopus vulgaris]
MRLNTASSTALDTDSDFTEKDIKEYHYGEDDSVDQNDSDSDVTYSSTKGHNRSAIGTRLVTGTNVSTHKTAKICEQLSEECTDIPAPCQQGIYKEFFKEAGEMKKHLNDTLRNQKWNLHFDGKHIDGNKYQAIVIKNEINEIKEAETKLCDGKAETVAEVRTLDEFHLWGTILMITADTTSANTG